MANKTDIEQLCSLFKTLIEKLEDRSPILKESKKSDCTRFQELEEKIKNIPESSYLFENDLSKKYIITPALTLRCLNHLQKCILLTSKYNFMNEYIDLYLYGCQSAVNYTAECGWSPLMIAVVNTNNNSSEETVRILIKHGAIVSYQSTDGTTALMLAALYSGNISTITTVEILLKHGAIAHYKNKDEHTALTLSIINFSPVETIKLLLSEMENCDVEIKGKKLINYIWDSKLSEDLVDLALKKGAKITDLYDERLINFLSKYLLQ